MGDDPTKLRVEGITHVALELSSPTRMERYVRDVFGLQLLREGYLDGEYVRIVGSPHDGSDNRGWLVLYNRPFIPRGRLRYIAFGVDSDVDAAVTELRQRGSEVDGRDVMAAPGGLRVKIDSFNRPRRALADGPWTKLVDAPVDHDLPCLWRGIHHVAPDVPDHDALLEWLTAVFGLDQIKTHDRRGELIRGAKYADGIKDAIGRRPAILPQFLRAGTDRVELNHIAFDVADAERAIALVESRGAKVDLPQDAMIHGPEEIWYQIDSRDTPYPVDHRANQTGVTIIPYHVG